jgi:hypothetical protein
MRRRPLRPTDVTRPRTTAAVLLVLAALLAGAEPAAAQCAMCQTVIAGSAEGRAMAGGLNRAILLMIAAPYVVFGILVAVFFRKRCRAFLERTRLRLGARFHRRADASA